TIDRRPPPLPHFRRAPEINPHTPGSLRIGAVGFRAGSGEARESSGFCGGFWVGDEFDQAPPRAGAAGRRWRGGESAMSRRTLRSGEEIAEECCFVCKDGGEDLRVCDFRNCLKSYHQRCVDKGAGFPSSAEKFYCDWHICVECRNNSDYQCLCCPFYSVCRNCLQKVKFVKMGKQNKGLCGNCFHLAISIEKNVADPQENIGYKDSNFSGILFKDYWNIIKERECLTLIDLQEAGGLLDRGVNCTHEKDAENFPRGDQKSDKDLSGDCDESEQTLPFDSKSKSDKMKTTMKRKRSKKKTYVGWGTEELIEFLACFGKDTKEPLDESEVVGAVTEYIGKKNLFLGDKKNYFQCDDKLHPLFTRRKVKYNMLHSKLRTHLAANAYSEDEDDDGSEDDNGPVVKKKLLTDIEPKIAMRVPERNKRCFASLNQHNINLLYLRRSLVISLLSHPNTFEQKVVGCIVRIKHNVRSHLCQKATEPFQLGLVTGIKKSREMYKVKGACPDVFLCVAGFLDDIEIPVLSDENIEEDEYNDLIRLVEKGLMKRFTVGEFEEKVAAVHMDIVNNCIDKELQRLEREIDSALDKKKLLSSPAERLRRLAVVPEIIADVEVEKETEVTIAAGNSCLVNRDNALMEATQLVADSINVLNAKPPKGVAECAAESFEVQKEKPPEGATEQAFNAFNILNQESSEGAADQIAGSLRTHEEKSREGATEKMADSYSLSLLNEESSEAASKQGDATREDASEAGEAFSSGLTPGSVLHSPVYKAQGFIPPSITWIDCVVDDDHTQMVAKLNPVTLAKRKVTYPNRSKGGEIPVREVIIIDTSDDDEDEEDLNAPECETVPPPRDMNGGDLHMERLKSASHAQGATNGVHLGQQEPAQGESVWHYVDPQGDSQGPFRLNQLRDWGKEGFFDEGFKVWRTGQTKEHAILLTDALRMNLAGA
ncbi:hypothetical protein EJB05_49259, partial [Eragrostis curvula]